jgi:regulator of sirC expression with transglutaminase-like and TPR domain
MRETTDKDISEIKSLVKLLDDEDGEVYAAARDRLIDYKESVLAYLPDITTDRESLASKRIEFIRETIKRSVYKEYFRTMRRDSSGDIDLEEGVFLIARQRFLDIDTAKYISQLNEYALELKEKLSAVNDHSEILRRTIAFFTLEKGFNGNHADYYSENNHYINKVLETRTGIPISLSLVYLLVGHRIDLPIRGIGLPGHFTLRFSFESANVYFDPYNNGKILSRTDCENIVKDLGFTFTEEYFSPVTNRQILERILRNIILSLEKRQETERIETIRQYIDSLNSNV